MIVVPLIILKHSRQKDRYSLLLLGPRTGKKTTRLMKLGMVYRPHLPDMSTINLMHMQIYIYMYF